MKKLLIFIVMLAYSTTAAQTEPKKEARLLYYDGTEYVVTDFSFFTNHIPISGTYFKHTKDLYRPLIVKTGKFWREIKENDIAKIRLELEPSKKGLKTQIELKNGKTISGIAPLDIHETWETGQHFFIQGKTSKFGQPATFKTDLDEIALVETIKEPINQIKIKTKKGEEKTAESVSFGVRGEMPYARISQYTMGHKIEIKSDGVELSLPLIDVKSFAFDEKGQIKILTKSGETGKISFLFVSKIFGRLENGDIIFDSISSTKGAKIKLIEF
jgi:hypothetical protein